MVRTGTLSWHDLVLRAFTVVVRGVATGRPDGGPDDCFRLPDLVQLHLSNRGEYEAMMKRIAQFFASCWDFAITLACYLQFCCGACPRVAELARIRFGQASPLDREYF